MPGYGKTIGCIERRTVEPHAKIVLTMKIKFEKSIVRPRRREWQFVLIPTITIEYGVYQENELDFGLHWLWFSVFVVMEWNPKK